ncbi:MAG: HAMP domain-containing histidine kinase [Gallionella sp.]|jgi:signal transduction histidine kinase|nr:HAMP domain-containing histidine kinase [Gallionella sp.]MCK9353013.1 HAMP domain-containing histidine kinase [Gallionella sp.]
MPDNSSRTQAQPEPQSPAPRSPARLFFIVAVSIMTTEIAIMFLFGLLPPMAPAVKNIVDGVLLTALLFPVLYLFLLRPMRLHKAALQQAEDRATAEMADRAMPHSPARLFLIVAISIFVAEIAIMFLFGLMPPMPPMVENFMDGILLTVLLLPILYLFLFRPLSWRVRALGQAEKSLRLQNEELKEKTRQLLEAQEELVRKEKLVLLGQVADTVGHELRNPLGVMNNAVYYLQTVLVDADETTREYLGIIKDEIADAERIVSDLLDAVRTKPPHPEAVDVAGAIGQTLRKCVIPPSVTVKLDIPQTPLFVRVDPMHLHQMLWNLISNAVEAMPEDGTLEIAAVGNEDGSVAVSVRDSGVGMTPEQQAQLFQPLFTTKTRRVGLGLVVVKNLAQANGGSVQAESVPGRGSVFTVTLPAAR